uniref:Pentacotripeptide-repeat region of PRORP domain-containing protein n=2 Tax=Nymphaea colorata TaxID=210225 RepID=A0A5K0VZ11_9MAGN
MGDPKQPFLWNTIIRGYCKSPFPLEALRLYNRMICLGTRADNFTFPFVLNACARAFTIVEADEKCSLSCKGAEVHCRIVHSGFEGNGFVQNSLIFMYSGYGQVEFARRVFDEMPIRTPVSWNTMIVAYDRCQQVDIANSLREEMPTKNVVSWNSEITKLVKSGHVDAARQLFDQMPERDAVSWNAMIAGYVTQKQYAEALELFRQMQITGDEPTEITVISMLGACAEVGELESGRRIHAYIQEKGFKVEGFMGNALIDMYAKCGCLDLARHVFHRMTMKHVSSWNAMIVGLAVHGQSEEALELFTAMEQTQIRPNMVTFLGVLTACIHKGLRDEARRYFRSMSEDYGIKPDIKHFGCMVDLYCRLGMLEEAKQVIDTMPFEPNCVVWRTLLSACRSSEGVNVKLAEKAIQGLLQLGPLEDMDYVLLSNVYAEGRRWKDVATARSIMLDSKVVKNPGYSQIQVGL